MRYTAGGYEELVHSCLDYADGHDVGSPEAMFWIAKAQVFATLTAAVVSIRGDNS